MPVKISGNLSYAPLTFEKVGQRFIFTHHGSLGCFPFFFFLYSLHTCFTIVNKNLEAYISCKQSFRFYQQWIQTLIHVRISACFSFNISDNLFYLFLPPPLSLSLFLSLSFYVVLFYFSLFFFISLSYVFQFFDYSVIHSHTLFVCLYLCLSFLRLYLCLISFILPIYQYSRIFLSLFCVYFNHIYKQKAYNII